VVNPDIATAANEKQRNDDYQISQLTARDVPTAPLNNGTFDGGMNKVFASKLDTATYTYDDQGHIHVPPLQPGRLPPQISNGPSDVATASTASNTGNSNSSGNFLGSLFGSKASAAPSQTASLGSSAPAHTGFFSSLFSSHDSADASAVGPPPDTQQTAAPAKPRVAARNAAPAATASVRLKPSIDANKADSQEAKSAAAASAPQKEANNAAPAANNGVIKGAQPVLPSGSFDSRWGSFQ